MTCAEGSGAMAALGVSIQKAKVMIRKVLLHAKAMSGLWITGINSFQAVTCAFHTPFMEWQEQLFKEWIAVTPLSQGTKTHFVSVTSMTDGRWLDRDLNISYWYNICHPVLSRTAINKISSDEGPNGV
ncbi:hypothetical protein L210DRAFT_3646183 [Boletus edulis BED1]|uniref:Uncharacterized protein n=1 Tax=Boletus edulis BED1 TaxID=1328754 RepID=A0AAD4BUB1_BOLED|nr:hypothetical protein L210DRAFT_3646183 [Boletus edulis BED1]